MPELAPGARQLPLHHISIRVPWHDRGWDGSVCADPKEFLALPPKEQAQVGAKLKTLTSDPHPDGNTKKQLTHVNRHVHRLRSGDYRVFYTFDNQFVSLLKLVRRSEDTYDNDIDAEFFGGPAEDPARPERPSYVEARTNTIETRHETRALPNPLTEDLLGRLLVPAEFRPRVMALKDEDALLACEGVPDDVLLRTHQAIFERPLSAVFEEKELVASSVDDLFRYRDGDLLAFLLRLSAEQEKFVSWAIEGGGPTLVKGGPGTGKSTVALYRVRAMLESLKKAGQPSPRILFSTYTNALVTFSEQLLRSLLGDDAQFVDVRTADSVALSIVSSRSGSARIATQQELRDAMTSAMGAVKAPGNSLVKRASVTSLAKLGRDYLIDEINSVIEARRLTTFEAYSDAKRPGRRVPLAESHRVQIWDLRDAFNRELKRIGKTTFQQVRAYAAQLVQQGHGPASYDAVVIDEAQDLDPSLLWILTSLAKAPNRVFLTADADQSIYGSGFRWADVHEGLKFKGRTGILRANFTSTREIGEAARAYLKREINERTKPNTRFSDRKLRAVPLYLHREESRLGHAFQHFRAKVRKLVAQRKRADQIAGAFAVEVLGKRLLSCPATFANSWWRPRVSKMSPDCASTWMVSAGIFTVAMPVANETEPSARRCGACTTKLWRLPPPSSTIARRW